LQQQQQQRDQQKDHAQPQQSSSDKNKSKDNKGMDKGKQERNKAGEQSDTKQNGKSGDKEKAPGQRDAKRKQNRVTPPRSDDGKQQQASQAKQKPEDSKASARHDVEEQVRPGRETDNNGKPQQPRAVEAGEPPNEDKPRDEAEVALEQWLRQIPDDPAGLLRRKFMLEHLRREQGIK